jgi:hypothetical protein
MIPMKASRRARALALLATLLTGCALFDDDVEERRREHEEALRSVDPQDGIDEREAGLLADGYFGTYISGCGVVGPVTVHDDRWEVIPYVGIAALPGPPIRIDVRTGETSWPAGPTVTATSLVRGETIAVPDG